MLIVFNPFSSLLVLLQCLAKKAGCLRHVSVTTLKKYFNKLYYKQLNKLGLTYCFQTEAEISHLWSGRRLSSGNASNVRPPPNPSRVDKLIVEHLREHAKVTVPVQLLYRLIIIRVFFMEHICVTPYPLSKLRCLPFFLGKVLW